MVFVKNDPVQGRIQEFKKGGAKLDRALQFFFALPAKLLRTPPPYRAVANRISKNLSGKKNRTSMNSL